MSAPRGPHGGGPTSGRSTPPPGSRGRGAGRDNTSSQFRGRGGRGRGTPLTTNPKAEGLLQGLQTGSFNKRGGSGSTQPGRGERILSLPRKRTEMCSKPNPGARFVPTQPRHFSSLACLPKKGRSSAPRDPSRSTRGHGAILNRANASFVQSSNTTARANPSQKDFMTEMTTKFQDVSHISTRSTDCLLPCRLLTFAPSSLAQTKTRRRKSQGNPRWLFGRPRQEDKLGQGNYTGGDMYGNVSGVREGGENCPEHGREVGKGLLAMALGVLPKENAKTINF
jgi:hypothetical protein